LTEHDAAYRFVEAVNSHDPERIRAVLAPDFTFEEVAGPGNASVSALVSWFEPVFEALPDITFHPIRQTREGDRTYVEFRAMGTHQGHFLNVPPTGTVALVSGVFNVAGSRELVRRLRLTVDFGGLRRQLLVAERMR
jgi:steroid delta-isomerase-like uncharacterized protein